MLDRVALALAWTVEAHDVRRKAEANERRGEVITRHGVIMPDRTDRQIWAPLVSLVVLAHGNRN